MAWAYRTFGDREEIRKLPGLDDADRVSSFANTFAGNLADRVRISSEPWEIVSQQVVIVGRDVVISALARRQAP